MVLSDSDDEKWIYREHTAAKHEVYQKYLTPWTYKLSSWNDKLRVIDCFAGRGSYVRAEDCSGAQLEEISAPTELPGSPQIILDRLTKHSDKFEEAEAIFIEANEENYDELDENISETAGIADNISVNPIQGEFQDKVLDLVTTDGSDCPTLFFIDPFGFKSLDYDVVTEIGSTDQFEILITFMSRDINRFLENEDHRDALETTFGTPDFIDEVGDLDPENWEPLVEYYTDRIEGTGPEMTFEYLITEPETRQTVYYLVFGTNHPNGLKTMRDVMNICGTGNFGYAPKIPEHDRKQSGLSAFTTGLAATKEFLVNTFSQYRIEFRNMVEMCYKMRKYEDDVESDYRKAIQELESEGQVEVIRRASKTGGTGVGKGDLIDFRDDDDLEDIG
ncbi:three-Cys-motif partner protein TcmP [Halorubrum sp. AD140]|uniref:three-Cys-motif partner protein TcmP n=1 Tax=Halorubrum sp. AD140 TaxID=3050073 RepID=UPI002ACD00C3|nr:three-Cys-motif partner protein TcmP [Halorubrum sp. AD140]MDZ5812397.1 three-Cys-motif partner protein TcmP [Halorubrum sp. AD140]